MCCEINRTQCLVACAPLQCAEFDAASPQCTAAQSMLHVCHANLGSGCKEVARVHRGVEKPVHARCNRCRPAVQKGACSDCPGRMRTGLRCGAAVARIE